MGVKFGNEWSSNGEDYGTEFKSELVIMKDRIIDMIEDLKNIRKKSMRSLIILSLQKM